MSIAPLVPATVDAELQPYDLGSAQVLSGDPRPSGRVFCRIEEDGSRLVTGIFSCQPGVIRNELLSNETVHVLEGRVHVALDSGEAVELGPGDVLTLPRGAWATWTFRTAFKELFILST